MIFGGHDEQWNYSNDLFIYDTETKEWKKQEVTGDKPKKKSYSTMTLINNKCFLMGGYAEY